MLTAAVVGAVTFTATLGAIASQEAAAASRSEIVSIAQGEYDNSTRNVERPMGSGCNYYTGFMRNWKSSSGCPHHGVQWRDSDWCADFVKYAWYKAGVRKVIVGDGDVLTGWARSFKEYGQTYGGWHARSSGYTPQPGDAISFDWEGNGSIDHVGVVKSANSSTVYTIEGNSSDRISQRSYSRSDGDIVGYTEPLGARDISGTASVYGVLDDGRLTYTPIDAATGDRGNVRVSTAALGFTPVAMATLNFNTLLITSTGGQLYRVDVITNRESLRYERPVHLGGGWTHRLLAYDGSGHLYGISGSGRLHRYTITATKPGAGNITDYKIIEESGFTLKTLTATGPDWLLGTTSGGALLSYKISGPGSWKRHELRSSTWQVFDHLLSPGGGVYFGHRPEGSMFRYVDANPYDGNGKDLTGNGVVDERGWTQTLLSAQPNSVTS
ncbi:CHAP domain-containing protein [Amycolatopsis aidingensis]|uniref:CHAP domain-containing protein n=1 Tax=Amycolatopsis aidingensis TaxID=2842453 RepID=UPI001C0C8FF4|nr:CHAP domain-containing protein [Amycolatopsis aidingensis]